MGFLTKANGWGGGWKRKKEKEEQGNTPVQRRDESV